MSDTTPQNDALRQLRDLRRLVEQSRDGFVDGQPYVLTYSKIIEYLDEVIESVLIACQPAPEPPAPVRELKPLDGGNWYYDYVRDIVMIDGRKFVPVALADLDRQNQALRLDERQACWEDVIQVIRSSMRDKPDSFALKALHEAIFVMGWDEFGTGDGKPLHKRKNSAVNEWNKEHGRK
jgi:hypothetical protein